MAVGVGTGVVGGVEGATVGIAADVGVPAASKAGDVSDSGLDPGIASVADAVGEALCISVTAVAVGWVSEPQAASDALIRISAKPVHATVLQA